MRMVGLSHHKLISGQAWLSQWLVGRFIRVTSQLPILSGMARPHEINSMLRSWRLVINLRYQEHVQRAVIVFLILTGFQGLETHAGIDLNYVYSTRWCLGRESFHQCVGCGGLIRMHAERGQMKPGGIFRSSLSKESSLPLFSWRTHWQLTFSPISQRILRCNAEEPQLRCWTGDSASNLACRDTKKINLDPRSRLHAAT